MKNRVLLAEDDLPVRLFMDEALHFLGYAVTAANDGAAALARLAAGESFDLVITDHRMPGLDGLGLVRALRESRFPGRIYVVSGQMPAEVEAEYRRLQVDGVLMKPLEVWALHRLLSGGAAAHAAA